MKKKIFTPFRIFALLFAGSILMSSNSLAQTIDIALTTGDAGLISGTTTDLSGSYAIQMTSGAYMTSDAGCESLMGSSNLDVKYSIDFVKLSDGKYSILSGAQKANFATNGWNIVFDNIATTNNEWDITLTADNTVTINKAGKFTKYEFARGRDRLYSDGGADVETTFMLEKVLTKKTVNLPVAGTFAPQAVTLTAGADLSGRYVIYNATGGYMTPNVSARADGGTYSLLSSVDPQYAFDLTKQSDGTYLISNGDFQLVSPDNERSDGGGVSFEYLPTTFNSWNINVVDASTVTIQSFDAPSDKYLTNVMDGSYKLKSNGIATDNINFSLLKVQTTAVQTVSENIKSTVFQSAGQLMVTKTENVKTIAIFNINGQKVYGSAINSGEVSIPVKNWSKGVYLLRLTDNEGGCRNIKTNIN
jgi:hypothetical protein